MNLKKFLAELQRRNVYRVAVAYGVVSWLLIQIATQIFPVFEIPNWGARLVILALALGFPVALVLAWAYEITPEGIKHTEDVVPGKSIARQCEPITPFGARLNPTSRPRVPVSPSHPFPFAPRRADRCGIILMDLVSDDVVEWFRRRSFFFARRILFRGDF